MTQSLSSCLIIGGGLSGLIAATLLQRQGIQVTVVDKGYGIGGRLASRSLTAPSGERAYFDYGTQHISVQTSVFQSWVDEWIQLGLVQEWSHGFWDTQGTFRPSPHLLYRGVSSTRSIAQHLAAALDVRNQTRIVTLAWQEESKWEAIAAGGNTFHSDAVIITSPVPQTLQLFDNSALSLSHDQRQQLEQVTYDCCIALMVLLANESNIPEPGGLYFDVSNTKTTNANATNEETLTTVTTDYETSDGLIWASSSFKKGISSDGYGVILQTSHDFSLQHWDDDLDAIAQIILEAASPWLNSSVLTHRVHRWKYSQPRTLYREPCAVINPYGPIVLAGDAFGSSLGMAAETTSKIVSETASAAETKTSSGPISSLERACLSGIAAANTLCAP